MKETNDGRKGGTLKGDPHSAPSGGMPAVVTNAGNKPVLLEGDEVIITKPAVKDTKVRTITGTNKEILSKINQSGGGVPILEKGGDIQKEALEHAETFEKIKRGEIKTAQQLGESIVKEHKKIQMKHISRDIYGNKYIDVGKTITDVHTNKKYIVIGTSINGLELKEARGIPDEGLPILIMNFDKVKENFRKKDISIDGFNNENDDHYLILCGVLHQIEHEKKLELESFQIARDAEEEKRRGDRAAKGKRVAAILELDKDDHEYAKGGKIPSSKENTGRWGYVTDSDIDELWFIVNNDSDLYKKAKAYFGEDEFNHIDELSSVSEYPNAIKWLNENISLFDKYRNESMADGGKVGGAERNKMIYKYVINHIDTEGYGVEAKTDAEKIKFLWDTFKSEYGWAIPRMGQQRAFVEWLQGLPSSFSIDYNYGDIIRLGKEWGILKEDATSSQEDRFIDSWWARIFMGVRATARKNKINLGTYAKGGKIPNNYDGKSIVEVWANWNKEQRLHFIDDHFSEKKIDETIPYMSESERQSIILNDELPKDRTFLYQLNAHIGRGQYKEGGKLGFSGLSKKVAAEYRKKGFDKKRAKEIGNATAAKIERKKKDDKPRRKNKK